MRRAAILMVVLGFLLMAAPAFAQSTIVIALEGVFTGNEGEAVVVHVEPVDPTDVGSTCGGHLQTDNNASVHPGNVLIIASGGVSKEIPGIEDEPGLALGLDGTLVLGDSITVSVRFGPDEITSLGMVLNLKCDPPVTTTTTTAPPETTTTTTPPTTTSTSSAPDGGVGAGGGGTAAGTSSSDQYVPVAFGFTLVLAVAAAGTYGWRRRSGL